VFETQTHSPIHQIIKLNINLENCAFVCLCYIIDFVLTHFPYPLRMLYIYIQIRDYDKSIKCTH